MLDQETIDQQRTLLATHRRTLAHLLRQAAIFGIFTPPYIAHSIDEARGNIGRLKVALRSAGMTVDNAPGDRPGTSLIERQAKWLRLLKVFIVVVFLGVIMLEVSGGIAGMRTRLDAWGVLPLIQPEQPDEALLVIAPFYYSQGNRDTEAHDEIKKAIQAAAKEAGLTNLRVELATAPLHSDDRDGAEQIGSRYNASLVVWGEDTGVRVTVNFLNRRGTPEIRARDIAISETARTQIADPPAYSRFITKDLPGQLSFLALFAVGQSFYIKQDYDTAIRVIVRAVRAVPSGTSIEGLADAYFRLGWLYQGPKHDAVQASVMYDQVIVLDPTFADAYLNRGTARAVQGDLKGARADYDQAIALDLKFAAVHCGQGAARAAQGDRKGALADFNQAIVLAPKMACAYNNRGLIRSDQGDLKGALADFNQAITLDPKDAKAYYNRGKVRYDQGDLKGALADYNQVIALDPKDAKAYYNRGVVCYYQGDLKGALADFNQAITLDPKDADAYNSRGLVYQQQGDRTQAIADFEQVLRLTDDVELRRKAEEQLRELRK